MNKDAKLPKTQAAALEILTTAGGTATRDRLCYELKANIAAVNALVNKGIFTYSEARVNGDLVITYGLAR